MPGIARWSRSYSADNSTCPAALLTLTSLEYRLSIVLPEPLLLTIAPNESMEKNTLSSGIRGHRTLATVVFTDCVGFSARMSEDEDHTLDLIRRDLKLMKRVCEHYEGRVLKSTGDGLLMHFSSAIKAVECAVEIQRAVAEAAQQLQPKDVLQHRIGVHLADMFITDTDVMGNGVNIAARLQAEADPGGICISQTVYDVVKAGLHLPTKYLGARELKNIREVVPAYKILMQPEPEETDAYAIVLSRLEKHRSLSRIKKLLFYACRSIWESNPQALDALNLRDLLEEAVKQAPSLVRLQQFLDAAVKTLSKPAEYSLIANAIVSDVRELYETPASAPDDPDSMPTVASAATVPPPPDPIQPVHAQIAQELESSSQISRIRKLLFYVCRNRWENDPIALNTLPLATLIAELHQKAPTIERLRPLMDSFVQTLSKQAEYALIANIIVDRCQRLYGAAPAPEVTAPKATEPDASIPPAPSPEAQKQQYREISHELEREQNVLRIKKLMLYVCRQEWANNAATLNNLQTHELVEELHRMAPTAVELEATLNSVVELLNKPDEYRAIAHTILFRFGKLYPGYIPPQTPAPEVLPAAAVSTVISSEAAAALPETPEQKPPQPANLFDARLEIMKYVNPLRAKILMFKALHGEFSYGRQDWLNLRMCELDGLLRQILTRCRVYTDLEDILYRTARSLSDPDEQVQVATRVIKSLRSFYIHGGMVVTLPPAVVETEIDLKDFQVTRLEGINEEPSEPDFTCRLLPTPMEDSTSVEIVNPRHPSESADQTIAPAVRPPSDEGAGNAAK